MVRKPLFRGVAVGGHRLHLSAGPKHSAGRVPALCGAKVYLDKPLVKTRIATCERCKAARDG